MNSDRIQTGGVAAAGVSAMSVGGGKAGDAASVAGLMSICFNAALPVAIGGSGGDGGAGVAVTVENAGRIETLNQFSSAIDASSIGGGAGYTGVAPDTLNALVGLLPIAKAVTANITIGGTGGGGGAVTVVNNGSISTKGEDAASMGRAVAQRRRRPGPDPVTAEGRMAPACEAAGRAARSPPPVPGRQRPPPGPAPSCAQVFTNLRHGGQPRAQPWRRGPPDCG